MTEGNDQPKERIEIREADLPPEKRRIEITAADLDPEVVGSEPAQGLIASAAERTSDSGGTEPMHSDGESIPTDNGSDFFSDNDAHSKNSETITDTAPSSGSSPEQDPLPSDQLEKVKQDVLRHAEEDEAEGSKYQLLGGYYDHQGRRCARVSEGEPGNIEYDLKLTPEDTEEVRLALYERFGAVPPADEEFDRQKLPSDGFPTKRSAVINTDTTTPGVKVSEERQWRVLDERLAAEHGRDPLDWTMWGIALIKESQSAPTESQEVSRESPMYVFDQEKFDAETVKRIQRELESSQGKSWMTKRIKELLDERDTLRKWSEEFSGKLPLNWAEVPAGPVWYSIVKDISNPDFELTEEMVTAAIKHPVIHVANALGAHRKLTPEQVQLFESQEGLPHWVIEEMRFAQQQLNGQE